MTRLYHWDRNQEIYDLVRDGKSYREIGAMKKYQMSHTNVARIFRLHRKKLRRNTS